MSKLSRLLRATAAWRISIWPTLAYALGTAVTFSIVYFVVAQGIRERSDAWLSGEAEVLAHVSAGIPRDRLYNRVVREVAELAMHELPQQRNAAGQNLNSVFFLEEDPKDGPLWLGPGSDDVFLKAIARANPVGGVPQSIKVEGWATRFRVVAQNEGGRTIYLGLSGRGAVKTLNSLARRFLAVWGATVLLGFLISYMSVRRTLCRVEQITETVARIGSEELGERLPEPSDSDEISRLAKTFNHMLDRIQSSVNQLRSVTDTVAHDLKSPVTSIRGTLESALSKEPEDTWRDSVGEAIEGLDKLTQLLNTVLDVAEAQAGALTLNRRDVDLSDVVKRLVEIYQPSMGERQHELVIDLAEDVVVVADPSLLNRVLGNLLENELAHLPAGCQIRIRLLSHEDSAELTIEDNGPGFPPDIVSRAFERFVKGKHSTGHGLGLAFVDAVVQAHGGCTKISGSVNGGAVITLSLPSHGFQVAHEPSKPIFSSANQPANERKHSMYAKAQRS
jgi:signal transduction histidine kinase